MICFLRHAQSYANKAGIYAGSLLDTELTPEGIENFRYFSKTNKIKFDKIFVSELNRSIKSGNIFHEEQSYQGEVIIDSRLNELNFGSLTGMSYMDFDNEQTYQKHDIESKKDFYIRIKSFYSTIKDSNENNLIIGHSGVAKMIQSIIDGGNPENYNDRLHFDSHTIYRLV